MMDKIKDVLGDLRSNSGSYAKRIGCRTSAIARTVGPKRGGIALGVLAAAIALPFIVRAVRRRREEGVEYDVEEDLEIGVVAAPRRRRGRRARAATSTHA